MKITEKQLIILLDIGKWFSQVNMEWRFNVPPYSRQTVEKLVNQIINQQSDELMEIK